MQDESKTREQLLEEIQLLRQQNATLKTVHESIKRERDQLQETLSKQEMFTQAVLDNLEDGIVACDSNGLLTLFNRAARIFHKVEESPLPPEAWSQSYNLYQPDGITPLPMEQIPLYRAFQGETFHNVEFVIAPPDAPRRVLLCNGQPLYAGDGTKLGAIVVMHDITEQREAETKLQKTLVELEHRVAERTTELQQANEQLQRELTERQRIEEALRTSEIRFRTIVEQSPLSTQILSPDGYTMMVNKAWEQLWGLTLDQLTNYNTLQDPQLVERGIMLYIQRGFAGEVTAVPAIVYDPNQTISTGSVNQEPRRWVRAVIYPVRDTAGQIREVVLVHEDMTERILAEQALRESEERYRRLVELSPEPIAVHSAGKMVYINQAGAAMVGAKSPEEIIGQTMLDFVHPDYRAIVIERAKQTQEDGAAADLLEEQFIRLDGQVIDVEVVAIPTMYNGQRATQVVMRDVTERKRAEQAKEFLTQASTLLSTSLDYQTTLVNLARLVVPAIADWCFVDVVEKDRTIRRVASAAANPTHEAILDLVREQYTPTWDSPQPAARALRSEKTILLTSITDEIIVQMTRSPHHFELMRSLNPHSVMAIPLLARGQIIGAITIATSTSNRQYQQSDVALAEDLAYRAALAIDNSRLYFEAQAAIQARDEFLSIAAHELKTPITSLRGFSQSLLRVLDRNIPPDLNRIRNAFTAIDTQSDKLAILVGRLLDISRLQAGRLVIDPKLTDLTALVTEIAQRAQTGTATHTITVDSTGTIEADVDPVRFEQVISNLIDNAVKYSPNGGPIEVQLEQYDSHAIRISVTDRGIGIPPEHRDHIFDRFFQAHSGTRFGGMGLGLYISREIIELHRGKLWFESPADGGSRFVIELPIEEK